MADRVKMRAVDSFVYADLGQIHARSEFDASADQAAELEKKGLASRLDAGEPTDRVKAQPAPPSNKSEPAAPKNKAG